MAETLKCSWAAAELANLCNVLDGNFTQRELKVINVFSKSSLRQKRTRAYLSIKELCELTGIDQKHIYAVLNPLIDDKVVDRLSKKYFALQTEKAFWDPERRPAEPTPAMARLNAEIAWLTPDQQQGRLIEDDPDLNEAVRENFVERQTDTPTPGAGEKTSVGQPKSGGRHDDGGLQVGNRSESGTASGEQKPTSPSLAARPADQSGVVPQPEYHQVGGIDKTKPGWMWEAVEKTMAAPSVVAANTTKSVVSEPTQPTPNTTKDVVSGPARAHAGVQRSTEPDCTNVKRSKGPVTKAEERHLMREITDFFTADFPIDRERNTIGQSQAFPTEMAQSGKFWRCKCVRNFPEAVEEALGQAKLVYAQLGAAAFDHKPSWLNYHVRKYAGVRNWKKVPSVPRPSA
jgi:hypothetical protein